MKQVIDGKIYDTETAEEIHAWSNGYYGSDFNHCRKTLYRTAKGAYFVHGIGGPLSEYREPAGDGWNGGEDIIPLDRMDVIPWLEKHEGAEVLIRDFAADLEEA